MYHQGRNIRVISAPHIASAGSFETSISACGTAHCNLTSRPTGCHSYDPMCSGGPGLDLEPLAEFVDTFLVVFPGIKPHSGTEQLPYPAFRRYVEKDADGVVI